MLETFLTIALLALACGFLLRKLWQRLHNQGGCAAGCNSCQASQARRRPVAEPQAAAPVVKAATITLGGKPVG